MVSSLGAWGVPDFGTALRRDRVSALIGRLGTRPVVLFGTSGCGKSIAAAHYVEGTGKRTVWIDACGEFPSAERVTQLVARVLGADARSETGTPSESMQPAGVVDSTLFLIESLTRGDGACIVLDDVGIPNGEADVQSLGRLSRALRSCSSQVVVTTRSVEEWPADVLREWEIVGSIDLALTSAEAEGLLERAGQASLRSAAEDLRDACGGHPAIFAVLARRAVTLGIEPTLARTESLDTWLDYLVFSQVSDEQRDVLVCASLLKSGDERELSALGVAASGAAIAALSAAVPLVSCARSDDGAYSFRVHDILDGFLQDKIRGGQVSIRPSWPSTAVEALTGRGDVARAVEVLARLGSPMEVAGWLESNGSRALSAGLFKPLFGLIDATPPHELMARPSLLLLWAQLCCEVGDLDDALAKCQAVRSLADHSGDFETTAEAISLSMQCLCRCHALDEAEELAREVLDSPMWQGNPSLRGEALLCTVKARILRGEDVLDSAQVLKEVTGLLGNLPEVSEVRTNVILLSAVMQCAVNGDAMASARILSSELALPQQLIGSKVAAMGNLGAMLLEVGRIDRCRSVLCAAVEEAKRFGLDVYVGAYGSSLGCALVASGDTDDGTALVRDGIDRSMVVGDLAGAACDRVYLAVVLRASGRLDESLTEAESAFERLSVADNMGVRRLAALEVAASLLALGDPAAARAWAESIGSAGPIRNSYHRLRADMILAEVDRQQGDPDAATARLAKHAEYIRSENANWQMAMYCRAFPELLGMLAIAVGPDGLPTHMLRMILPENAEIALGRTKDFVDQRVWKALGCRLLGKDEFEKFMNRGGMPLCHVRMFGGLEINIGNRSVRERDWRKRKARLLFAMLAIRLGHDVPREQIFDHLWPEMDEERAKSNLYVIWSAMKHVLMGDEAEKGIKCPYVESLGGVCRSVRDTVRTDVALFEIACADAREAEASGRTSDAMKAYRQMAEVYRGDLLPGDCYDDWFANLREHYRAEFMDAMLKATRHLLDADDPHTALMFVRRAIQHDEFREDLYNAALRCQIAAGQRSSAIETYMQCRDKLCDELGLDPSVEMRALYGEILAMEDGVDPVKFDPLAE